MPDRRSILRSTLALTSGALSATAMTSSKAVAPSVAGDSNPVRDAEIAFAATMAKRDFKAFAEFVAEDAVFIDGKLGYSTGPVLVKDKLVARFASTWRLDPDGRWRVVFDNGSEVCECKDK